MTFDFTDYKNIKIIGDIHGSLKDILFPIIKDIKNSLIICTGDLPIGQNKFSADLDSFEYISHYLEMNNSYLCIIRGNHDNPKYFKEKSTMRKECKEYAPNVILIPDYSVIKTADHSILCIGGARSIDRVNKIKNYSWWQNENIQKPSDDFYSSLSEKIDIVVSHSAPLFAQPLEFSNELKHYNSYIMNSYALYDSEAKNDVYKERLLLKGIYERLNNMNHIQKWLYGHYHTHIDNQYCKTKFISLKYRELVELD